MEAKMFSLKPSPEEINDVFYNLQLVVHPNTIKLVELTRIIFGTATDIQQRKVRLAIAHLRKLGFLIIGERGYYMAGDDPEPVIHFINGMYSRAHSLTTDTDIMYHGLKQKYGDAVSEKVQQMPGQPMMTFKDVTSIEKHGQAYSEPAFRKSYSPDGTLHNL